MVWLRLSGSKVGTKAYGAWIKQVREVYERAGVRTRLSDILVILRGMHRNGEWMSLKQVMREHKDLIQRLGSEDVLRGLMDAEEFLIEESLESKLLVRRKNG